MRRHATQLRAAIDTKREQQKKAPDQRELFSVFKLVDF
jgi:hypothetical protein